MKTKHTTNNVQIQFRIFSRFAHVSKRLHFKSLTLRMRCKSNRKINARAHQHPFEPKGVQNTSRFLYRFLLKWWNYIFFAGINCRIKLFPSFFIKIIRIYLHYAHWTILLHIHAVATTTVRCKRFFTQISRTMLKCWTVMAHSKSFRCTHFIFQC